MRLSKQAKREAKELFRACQVDGLLQEDRVRQAVRQVIEKRPRGYTQILHFFHRLVKLDVERRTARVESAVPLTTEQQVGLQSNLHRLYGAGLTLQFTPKPDLLGGLRIRVGSDVYDGSIEGRLERLREAF